MKRAACNHIIKSIFFANVKGGVLQLTLGIGIIVCVICSGMILLVYFSRLFFLQNAVEAELRENALSGIQYGIAVRHHMPFNEKQRVDLFGEESDSIEIFRRPWGVFEVITTKAWRGTRTQQRTALVTALPDELGNAIIYTPDNNAPLYLAGATSLTGTAYVSERKLATGYISGKGYSGKRLISGDLKQSKTSLPSLDTLLLSEIKNVVSKRENSYQLNLLNFLPVRKDLPFADEYSNYYHTNQSMDLYDSLSGNLIIQSEIRIRVTAGAVLSDVILLAPDIDIDNNFKGNLQCFATRSITIGRNCNLNYPSALVLLGHSGKDSLIVLKDNSVVTGQIVLSGYGPGSSGTGKLKIEKKALLHGMAYVNGRAEVQGSVWGHVTAKTFVVSLGSSEYPNHIFEGEINSQKKSAYLPGSLLWASSKEMVIAKWLN